MNIEVCFSPVLFPYRTIKDNHITLVVDVLRATTSICAALHNGCSSVVAVAELEEVEKYRSLCDVVVAERGGEQLEGSMYPNSPLALLKADLFMKRLLYCTTNGTRAIDMAKDTGEVVLGGFCNITALEEYLREQKKDVVVLCSGWKNNLSLEDSLFAGELCTRLSEYGFGLEGDSSKMAYSMFQDSKGDILKYCEEASHVWRLYHLGYRKDVLYSLTRDSFSCVPKLIGKEIVI